LIKNDIYQDGKSGIRDQGSGIRDQGSGIRVRHLSAPEAKSQNSHAGKGCVIAGLIRNPVFIAFRARQASPLRKKGSGFACPFFANSNRPKVGFYFWAPPDF
jgi:hypothetical protein